MGLTFATKPRGRIRRFRIPIALAVVIGIALGGVFALVRSVPGPPALPKSEVDTFLRAWESGDTRTMASRLDRTSPDLAAAATSLVDSVKGSQAHYTRTSLERDATGGGATATYSAHIDVAGFGPVDWKGTLHLKRVKQSKATVWLITWKPSDLFPGLQAGQHLAFERVWPSRAAILASDGTFLAGSQAVVKIGLEPDRITKSLPKIKKLMRSLVGTTAAAIDAALHGPGVRPNYFVEIASVPDDARYRDVLRPKLAPVDGVFFQHHLGVLAPAGLLGSQLIGSVGEITAERLKQLGPPYRVGDPVGLGGLQAAFETRLAGRPTGTVSIASKTKVVRTVKEFSGQTPQPVTVTIDPRVQQAADTALAGVTLPAALVAVDTATGQIRAIVSKPDNGFARALDGAYPPGSTFKVITTTALLAAGRTGSTPAPCPPTLTVDGQQFANFEGEAAGALNLADAFKISCNNAFIGLADKLPDDALAKAASSYGFNSKWSLPLPSYGGTFPRPRDRAELAASAIGQGRVLASPLQMASVAAAVASGQWHAPTLTTDPAPAGVAAPPIDGGIAATLRGFMSTVVGPGGTAAGAGLPADVFGKTGTAEFGKANPPETHAWFIGYRGSLAFAVIVEGGGVGGRVAAPLAAKFLNALG
jgi:cell division protein FtsI/penicillin-binding protein 2